MKFKSKDELKQLISEKSDFQLIDVRESYEFEDDNIGGENIPLAQILDKIDLIDREKIVIFCCKTGKRSGAMTMTLERKFGMNNLYSLEGGIESFTASN